jgi:hypothetical protein
MERLTVSMTEASVPLRFGCNGSGTLERPIMVLQGHSNVDSVFPECRSWPTQSAASYVLLVL